MSINDLLYRELGNLGFEGHISDRMFDHLRSLGHTGTTSDMLLKEGGYSAYVNGLIKRQAPLFNGTDQYLTIPNFQNDSGTFTFEVSIIPDSIENLQIIIDSDTTNNALRVQAGGQVRFRLTDSMGAIKNISSAFDLSVGTRYDIKCVATPSQMELIINGASQGTTALPDPILLTPNWNAIGATSGGSFSFQGFVYDVNLNGLRDYKMDDGFGNDPTAVDSISTQNGTFVNMGADSWKTIFK